MTILGILLSVSGCAHQAGSQLPNSQVRDNLLGTVITVSIYEETDDSIFDDVFNAISLIEQRMSANLPDSEVAGITAAAGKSPVMVSEDTFYVIKQAYETSIASGGAFNLAIGPLVRLWGIATEAPRVPSQAEIEHVQNLLDYNAVRLSDDDRSVFLELEGMSVDLGAIAKGYAGDVAGKIVREHGVGHAILDLGGNIVTVGGRPDGTDWRVGIKNPIAGEQGYIGSIPVKDKAVVTSGIYERYFESGGDTYHHILDSKTGYPSCSELLSVSVVSNSSTDADRLTTAAFVLGLEDGMDFLKGYKNTEAVFVTTDFEIYLTPGLKDSFKLADDRFRVVGE